MTTSAPLSPHLRAAQVMLILGILAAVFVVPFGIVAVLALTDASSGGDWGGLKQLVALIFGAIGLFWLLVAGAFLVARHYVRKGGPRGLRLGIVVTVLATILLLASIGLLWAGNNPGPGLVLLFALGLGLWLEAHVWILVLLRRALKALDSDTI